MGFWVHHDNLLLARDEAQQTLHEMNIKPRVLSIQNITTFWGEMKYAAKLILEEKEIILFTILQWLVIVLAYMVWAQIFDWIPDSLWA